MDYYPKEKIHSEQVFLLSQINPLVYHFDHDQFLQDSFGHMSYILPLIFLPFDEVLGLGIKDDSQLILSFSTAENITL